MNVERTVQDGGGLQGGDSPCRRWPQGICFLSCVRPDPAEDLVARAVAHRMKVAIWNQGSQMEEKNLALRSLISIAPSSLWLSACGLVEKARAPIGIPPTGPVGIHCWHFRKIVQHASLLSVFSKINIFANLPGVAEEHSEVLICTQHSRPCVKGLRWAAPGALRFLPGWEGTPRLPGSRADGRALPPPPAPQHAPSALPPFRPSDTRGPLFAGPLHAHPSLECHSLSPLHLRPQSSV